MLALTTWPQTPRAAPAAQENDRAAEQVRPLNVVRAPGNRLRLPREPTLANNERATAIAAIMSPTSTGSVGVEFMDKHAVLGLVGKPEIESLATQVRQRPVRVMAAV